MEFYPPIVQVTDKGEIIGPIFYEIAHAKNGEQKGKRHLTAQICIFRTHEYNELLISQRGNIDRKGKLNIGVGGHAEWIESEKRAQTPLETALKETSEEIFYKTSLPENLRLHKLISLKKDIRLEDPEYVYLFYGIYSGPFWLNPKEVTQVYFTKIDELKIDLKKNPERYTRSAEFYLDKFLKIIK